MMSLDDLIPAVPHGFGAWEAFLAVALIAVLKLFRARVLKHRSVYVDRFGWSIIIYDVVFGISALIGLTFGLYPGLTPHIYISRIATGAIIVVAAWQLFEVWRADNQRVDAAVSGTVPVAPTPPTDPYDRRKRLRREDDVKAYTAWQEQQ